MHRHPSSDLPFAAGIARWCHPWTRTAGRLVALLAVAISVVLQGLADPPPPLREYDVLRSLPEGWLEWLSRNDLPDDQGLAGGNRGQGRWIEAGAQRGSCRAVIAAVVAGDLARADRAWRGIEVTFEHQRADGGFSAAERPNGGSSANGAAAVETAYFFLQELGRAILVIRQSPHEAHFRDRVQAIEPRLRRACDFIAAGEPTILPKSRKAVNRVFIAAKAFGTCGRVLGDEALVGTARRLVAEALKQRDDEGVFLEHGGRDSSYNAVTLLFAQALALHVSLPELDEALKPAARWQVSRVLASGEVDARGNTRTGVGKEPGYDGQPKGINHNEVILALALHGIVHRNPEALDAAGRVMAWTRRGTATQPASSGGPAPAAVRPAFRQTAPEPRWLPGSTNVHFAIYGGPSEPRELESFLGALERLGLADAMDPGPSASAGSRAAFEVLARRRWPVILYPPDGGRMQLEGGTSLLSAEDEAAVRILDGAGVFTAIQLGEWGYHYHRLRTDPNWMRDVLGKDFEAQRGRFLRPPGTQGYDPVPTTRREAYDQLRQYFLWHRQAKGGRVISVTGHSHYEAYAAEWGASVVGIEVGENIGFTQSKIAFTRGAARQWNLPFSVQMSPWFGNAVTTRGPLDTHGPTATGLDAGHSLSLCQRMWRHAWFAGAALVTPENSVNSFFETGREPWALTSHGRAAAEVRAFFRAHDRGNPHTPLLVVLDHLAGYNGYIGKTWGIFPRTPADQEVADLLESRLFGGMPRPPLPGNPPNPEADYLKATRHGEWCDVVLSTATGAFLARYPVILLAGELEFGPGFVRELETALASGSRLLLRDRHVKALTPEAWDRLRKAGVAEVLAESVDPVTGRPAAIPEDRLRRLAEETLPVAVEGDPIQYQINRNRRGWVVELVQNDGVAKTGRTPARVFPERVAKVRLIPRFGATPAREWMTGRSWTGAERVEIEVPPGETRFVEFDAP
jgi:hypothetical protein